MVLVLERVASGKHALVSSDALAIENSRNSDRKEQERVQGVLSHANIQVRHEQDLENRAAELISLGFRFFDAYHVACAESAKCDRLVTCDDKLLKVARRNADNIDVTVTGLMELVSEVDF